MQELMSRHKAYSLSPRDCLKTTLFQKWQRMVAPPGKRGTFLLHKRMEIFIFPSPFPIPEVPQLIVIRNEKFPFKTFGCYAFCASSTLDRWTRSKMRSLTKLIELPMLLQRDLLPDQLCKETALAWKWKSFHFHPMRLSPFPLHTTFPIPPNFPSPQK